jgi:FkbM family methyltransferase
MSDVVSRWANRARLLNLLGRLGVRAPLWRIYCRWFGPEGGIVQLDLDEHHARFYVPTDWTAATLKSFDGEQVLLSRLISSVGPGDAVFDVGANMGLHAVFLGQAVGPQGRVVAFEPEPHTTERLRSNLALNGLSNVRVVPMALGDHSYASDLLPSVRGLASPRLAEPRAVPSGAESAQRTSPARGSLKVQVVEGDPFVETEKLPVPRLVKIDVEGHEVAVLRGLRRTLAKPACQIVCCEVHPKLLPEGLNPDEIVHLLKSCGFTRFDILPRDAEHHVLAFKESVA